MRKKTTEEFITDAKLVHGDKYDYSKVEYFNHSTKVCIICLEHGEFWQRPNGHVSSRYGCPICAKLDRIGSFIKHNYKNRNWDFKQPENYKLIPLTKGKFAKVSNEDFNKVKDINWHISGGYASSNLFGGMHRHITNCTKSMVVDHINHDTLDNRRGNLRVATRQQNAMNQETQIVVKTSKYKGVCWNKEKGKWQSKIKKDGKSIYIGRYDTEEEAGLAYNKKALELFGEFAKLNIL